MTSQPAPTAAKTDGGTASERAGEEPARPGVTRPAPPPILDELPLVADQMIAGKYRLLREIGHGGMGAVWEAEHQALGRRVAVKFLKPWNQADPSMPSRFESEARMVASIKHRFVVDVFDFGITDDGLYYMVLELLDGKTLAQHMNATPLPAREAVHLIADCLRGLHAVHEAGIVHRDLKPENIFVIRDADGMFPKLIDFGISKRDQPPAASSDDNERRKSRLTQPGTVVGTINYMPPEQLRGRHEVDRRADVYGMGVILYELLAGRLPYDADNVADLMVEITNTGAPPLSRRRRDLGSALSNVIARALSAAPEARFPTALALRDALMALLPSIPADASTGTSDGGFGRGHATELQLAAAAAAFGEVRGGLVRRRGWWIGLSIGGALLLGWLLFQLRPSAPTVAIPAVRIEPPAAAVQAATSSAAASTAASPSVNPPPAPSPAAVPASRDARKARSHASRPSTKDGRSSKDGKARAGTGTAGPKKVYRELDF
jgi:eukaryotic-like serine/threonine-protein kinase